LGWEKGARELGKIRGLWGMLPISLGWWVWVNAELYRVPTVSVDLCTVSLFILYFQRAYH